MTSLNWYETIYFWVVVDFTIIGLLAVLNRKMLIETYKLLKSKSV